MQSTSLKTCRLAPQQLLQILLHALPSLASTASLLDSNNADHSEQSQRPMESLPLKDQRQNLSFKLFSESTPVLSAASDGLFFCLPQTDMTEAT